MRVLRGRVVWGRVIRESDETEEGSRERGKEKDKQIDNTDKYTDRAR